MKRNFISAAFSIIVILGLCFFEIISTTKKFELKKQSILQCAMSKKGKLR
jgi:hypothetical protein